MTGSLSANAGIPAGLRGKAFDDTAGIEKHAAGILFVAPDGDILLLRRGKGEANFAGHWALPGGGVEGTETPQLGASREAREEIGQDVDPGGLKLMDRTVTPTGIAFHTFAQPVREKFVPKLNDEHSGYAWTSLDMLPQPLHPAVGKTLETRLGIAKDMKPEEWDALRETFVKWTNEEQAEPEHATDSALVLAFDRESVRSLDRDGRLRVAVTNLSKANVCPYRGEEIPGWKELGLERDKVYQLLRDPDELAKAAPTFNGIQLLRKHVPVNAEDHRKHDIIGTTGTEASFEAPYLRNSLHVWAQDAIGDIERATKRELSCGYHYRPDMTPGIFDGMRYDGVMRDIVGNHVALVEDGRAGPDVVVGDSTENLMSKPTRIAAMTLAMTSAAIAPCLAMDSAIKLSKDLFTPITFKTFKTSKAKLLEGVRLALDGKLRKGLALDATMEGLAKAIDAFEGNLTEAMDDPIEKLEESEIAPIAEKVEEKSAYDAEPLKAFLKEKGMADDDIMKACDMLPKSGVTGDESDDDEDDEKKKKDVAADSESDDDKDKDKDGAKDMVSKPAMDEAIKLATDAAIKKVQETERGIRVALHEVKPWIGELPATMAFDSAEAVYRHTLKALQVRGYDALHADALLPVLQAQPRPNAKPARQENALAMDSSALDKAQQFAPGLSRITVG